MGRLGDHLKLMRPATWVWFDTSPTLALLVLLNPTRISVWNVLFGWITIILSDSSAVILNDIYDIETDKACVDENRKKRGLASGRITQRAAMIQYIIMIVTVLFLSSCISYLFAFFVIIANLLAVIYSLPPFRICAHPILSQPFWVVFGVSVHMVMSGLTKVSCTKGSIFWLIGFIFFFALGENFSKDLRDYENDKLAGKTTVVVALGTKVSSLGSLLGCFLGSLSFLYLVWHEKSGIFIEGKYCVTTVLFFWLIAVIIITILNYNDYSLEKSKILHRGYVIVYMIFNFFVFFFLSSRFVSMIDFSCNFSYEDVILSLERSVYVFTTVSSSILLVIPLITLYFDIKLWPMKSESKGYHFFLFWGCSVITFFGVFVIGYSNLRDFHDNYVLEIIISFLFLLFLVIFFFSAKKLSIEQISGISKNNFYTGFYSISRNPQYTCAFIMIILFQILVKSTFIKIIGGIGLLHFHLLCLCEEPVLEKEFGEDYKTYVEEVPRYLSVMSFFNKGSKNMRIAKNEDHLEEREKKLL